MNSRDPRSKFSRQRFHAMLAVACTASLSGAPCLVLAQAPQQAQSQVMTTTSPAPTAAPTIPNDQLDSLVAPIALYPDPLLAQTLAASTYPLEVVQLQQWMGRNKNLKDKALVDAIANQPWEPSVQSMAAYPDALERMATNIQWTTELGNAFLAQQSDVMAAIQRMRMKAQGKGTLKTDWHQKVETADGRRWQTGSRHSSRPIRNSSMFHRTIRNTSTARRHIPIILIIIRVTCRVTAFGSGRV